MNHPISQEKRVYIGLSGGVDSAVSAALLKKRGYEVTGVFIKAWQPDWIECTWREERLEAMRAAAHIGIPFRTLDLEKEYKREVIDYLVSEYARGRTPNPDVMCNRRIKFGAFRDWARSQGADFVATGHYARIARNNGRWTLLAGRDREKDQSYFLWTLGQGDLERTLFPVGDLLKPEVRALARRFRLPNAFKKDSQGLCFVGALDFKEFLARALPSAPGRVLDQRGETIGSHPGALFFTIGERHGFSIDKEHKTPADRPYYVIEKDVEQNTITVSTHAGMQSPSNGRHARISGVNWTKGSPDDSNESALRPLRGRHRYRQPLQRLRLSRIAITDTAVDFEEPQDTLTPGQSLVIYDGDECLGGGIIED